MSCPCRVTKEAQAQYFADRRHKFYLEYRCNLPLFQQHDTCIRCLTKTSKIQGSRTFPHGMVSDPIPEASHIYGGTWYEKGIKAWGAPPGEIQEVALQYQKAARALSKAENRIEEAEMARPKKEAVAEEKAEEKPRVRRAPPKKKADVAVAASEQPAEAAPVEEKPIRKAPPKRKTQATPYSATATIAQPAIHREVVLPTHMEQTVEEIDTDGYEIEYVKLRSYQIGQTTYFRDFEKNKLYRRIKENVIGSYVGRYDPERETIHEDVPDSDNESI